MDNPDNQTAYIRRLGEQIIALLLWAVSLVLGFMCFVYIQDITGYVTASIVVGNMSDFQAARVVRLVQMVWVVISGMILLALAVGGFDYHSKKAFTPQSWRVFAWTFGIGAAIILLRVIIVPAPLS